MINRILGAAAAALLTFAGAGAAPEARAGTLDQVKSRGQLVCGVNVGVAGFSMPDSQGTWRGLDVDLCRAVAAAVLGDPTKVRFVPLTAVQRFTALQSGEIDVLIRQTTQTLTRDATLGLRMTAIYLYDGHAFMVKKSLGITESKQLNNATICLSPGTTNELVTADWAREIGIKITPVLIERPQDAAQALLTGRCDAYGTDATALAGIRTQFQNPGDFLILPERLSKEPYGPVVRKDDPEWFDVIRWTIMLLIEAEESGITQANAAQLRQTSTNPTIRRVLGAEPLLGKALKLNESWGYDAIRAVGNYGEIYDRNIGPETPLSLPRGVNELWTKGGLMYAWPMR